MDWCRERKLKLIIYISLILIPVIFFASKIICLNEIKKMAADATEKIVKSGYISSLSDSLKLIVSGETSVVISDFKNLDAEICYNPKLQRVEAVLENKLRNKSNVQLFYGSGESGISIGKHSGKFYTVDNRKNIDIGDFVSGLTNKKTGIAVKYLTDGSWGAFAGDLYRAKELIRKNKTKIVTECFQLMTVSDIKKLKNGKKSDEAYSISIPSLQFARGVCDIICEENGFDPSVVSASNYLMSKIDKGNIDVVMNGSDGVIKSVEINIPALSVIYTLNVNFFANSHLSAVSLINTKSEEELFFVKFFEGDDKKTENKSDFRLCITPSSRKIFETTELFGLGFSGKNYILKKINDDKDKSIVVEDTLKNKDVCTITLIRNKSTKVEIVQKENLYETKLDKVIEIGNTLGGFFG